MSLWSLGLKFLISLKVKPWDPLLLIACLLFFDPSAPAGGSSMPALIWVVCEMIFCSASNRILLWSLGALLLTGWQSVIQYPESVLDFWDILLLIVSVVTISSLRRDRFLRLQLMLLLALPVGAWLVWIHPVPPENMRAFLSGMLATLSLAHATYMFNMRLKILLVAFAFAGLWMGYGYDSVASILFPLIAFFLGFAASRPRRQWLKILLASLALLGFGFMGFAIYSIFHPTWAHSQYLSNLGRVQIWWCHWHSAFSSLHQFLYGVGFDKTIALCRQPTAAGILPHAHSFPLQVMSGSGALGFLGVAAFLCLFLLIPLKNWSLLDKRLKVISISGLSYFLMQCSIDISVFVNPVTIVLAGFLVASPIVFSGQSENCSH
jgi:hypothetical protein